MNDTDRSHYLVRNRQIIVKFTSYRKKLEFIPKRKALRDKANMYHSVYLNEDLTHERYKLLRILIQLKAERRIYTCWTHDGTLCYKKDESAPSRIKDVLKFDIR